MAVGLSSLKYASLHWKKTFAELFLYLSEDDERVDELRVAKVTIADRGSSSGGGADVDLTVPPVALCEEFSAEYVGLNPTRTNVLEVLMRASRDRSYLLCMFFIILFWLVGPLF